MRPSSPQELTKPIGWASGLRLGIYYAFFFSAVSVALFGVVFSEIAEAIHQRELEIVRNRAQEYRAWYLSGDFDMLEARMDEQSLESGDVMFVRLTGPEVKYLRFYAPSGGVPPPAEELWHLDPSAMGDNITLGGERWAVFALPLGERGLVLQAGKNGRAGQATLARARKVFFVVLIPAMLAAMLGGALLTYRALAPVRRLVAAMREILRGGDLSRRVEPERGRSELNALVDLFNRLLARNESLIEAMGHSLDSVAHDFRTPLSRLHITAERALRETSDPEPLRDALVECVEETEHLNSLLTVLMEVAEAESGVMRLEVEEFSLPDLIESVVELYEFVADEKKIVVTTDLPDELMVRGDRSRLGRALANLVDNGIKYSATGGKLEIAARREEKVVVITVRDDGMGIDPQDVPHLWDRLYRAEPSRSTPGMGLGLSFVKAIVEAHGGTVSVQSMVNEGATFRIELPDGVPAPETPRASMAMTPTGRASSGALPHSTSD